MNINKNIVESTFFTKEHIDENLPNFYDRDRTLYEIIFFKEHQRWETPKERFWRMFYYKLFNFIAKWWGAILFIMILCLQLCLLTILILTKLQQLTTLLR